ncbi:MAG: DUF4156 domain-containing protein [Bacteroides sp.]|nr:DUF4156 domain-containing protein [Prevotella sp.]MCM1408169.1 DUF4156 domain-containing protein [Treponema brennaborense]MCM1469493.1 DUF4156 domain-containing protein [Bacteroides sp.]
MKKLTKFMFVFCAMAAFFAASCASGSHIVTGTQREAIGVEEVKIFTEFPETYEVIGIVSASSDAGWTEQGSLNYAIKELKNQAAKIGANGIVIESTGQTSAGAVLVGNMFVPVSAQTVSAKAIYIEHKNSSEEEK